MKNQNIRHFTRTQREQERRNDTLAASSNDQQLFACLFVHVCVMLVKEIALRAKRECNTASAQQQQQQQQQAAKATHFYT